MTIYAKKFKEDPTARDCILCHKYTAYDIYMQHTIHIFEKTNNNLILYSLQLLFTNQFCTELKI